MQKSIIEGTNIDFSLFSYSVIKLNPKGGKVVNLLNISTEESLILSTPAIFTWGAQEGMDQQRNPTGKYTMSLQFPQKEYKDRSDYKDAVAFLESMKKLESKIQTDALSRSLEWFGKEIKSADVMEEKFNPMLKYPKKEKGKLELDYLKSPTVSVKIPCKNGNWQSEIFDEEGQPLFLKDNNNYKNVSPIDFIKPKIYVMCIIQCAGLWFVNGKVSITWDLKQCVVKKQKSSSFIQGICLLKPKADDLQKMNSTPAGVDVDNNNSTEKSFSATIVDDSDDSDDSDNDSDEELPIPIAAAGSIEKISEKAAGSIEKISEKAADVIETKELKKMQIVTKKKVEKKI